MQQPNYRAAQHGRVARAKRKEQVLGQSQQQEHLGSVDAALQRGQRCGLVCLDLCRALGQVPAAKRRMHRNSTQITFVLGMV
jgi:hypothetical protein